MKYLALKDCPNHSELFCYLQNLKDDFHKSLCIPSVVSYLPGIKRYQDFLKRFYMDIKIEAQDVFKTNIHQYVYQFKFDNTTKPRKTKRLLQGTTRSSPPAI